jgi:hypothetical protein
MKLMKTKKTFAQNIAEKAKVRYMGTNNNAI